MPTFDFTEAERLALVELIRENIAYYHETLREEHETLEAALAAYDATDTVTALTKLAPEEATKCRESVKEGMVSYFGDDNDD